MSIPDLGFSDTHEDPTAFLVNAIVSDLTPRLGLEIRALNSEGRDQSFPCVVRPGRFHKRTRRKVSRMGKVLLPAIEHSL